MPAVHFTPPIRTPDNTITCSGIPYCSPTRAKPSRHIILNPEAVTCTACRQRITAAGLYQYIPGPKPRHAEPAATHIGGWIREPVQGDQATL